MNRLSFRQLRVVALWLLLLSSSCSVLATPTPLPGWRDNVRDHFVDATALPTGWSIVRAEDSYPQANHVHREFGNPPSSGIVSQDIWRAYTIADAEEKYAELRQSQFQPRLAREEMVSPWESPEEIEFRSEVADEWHLACGWEEWAYCQYLVRYRNYVTYLRLDREAKLDDRTSQGLTYAEIEAVLKVADAKFGTALEQLFGPTSTVPASRAVPSMEPPGVGGLAAVGELKAVSGGLFALSPDGSSLATSLLSEGFTTVDLFNVDTGALEWSFDKGIAGVNGTSSYTFAADGTMLAAGGFERVVYVLAAKDGKLLHEFSLSNFINAVAFSADGQRLAAASSHERGMVRVWSLDDESFLEYPASLPALDLAFGPAEPVLAIAYDHQVPEPAADGGVLLWDLESGAVKEIFAGRAVQAVAFAPGGDFLAASVEGRLHLWQFEGERATEAQGGGLPPGGTDIRIVFIDKGIFAASATTGDHRAGFQTMSKVWNTSGELLGEATFEGQQYIEASRTGELLVGEYGESVKIWRVRQK